MGAAGTLVVLGGASLAWIWANRAENQAIVISGSDRGISLLPAPAPSAGGESALEIARRASPSDQRMIQWISRWSSASQARQTGGHQDERQIAELLDLLPGTPLDINTLFKIGQVFSGKATAADNLAGRHFFIAAVKRVQSELARRAPPDPQAASCVQMLWNFCSSLSAANQWDLQRDMYQTLIRWEPAGSARLYRARLKYADALLYSGDATGGLEVMNSLMADIGRGLYPMANPHDVVPLYWAICDNAGKVDQGLQYLRNIAKNAAGTEDEARMTATLIAALSDCGQARESRRLLDDWLSKFAGSAPPRTVQQLRLAVAVAQGRSQKEIGGIDIPANRVASYGN